MKQLNLSENQMAELREIYRGKLSQAQATVDEIRNVLRQLESSSAPASVGSGDSAPVSTPGKRGRKPGRKAGKKGAGRKGRPAASATATTTETSADAATTADAPKKRGRKPGFKPSAITKAGKPAKRRGRKPKNA
jgi:hypothetical protein